jgi:RnfABCDGE-type electron transport complex G subunit
VIKVIPGASSSQKLYEEKDFTVYRGNGEGNQVLGYAFYTTISGFQDKIVFLFGTNALLTRINSLCILEQKETPGLGAKITDQEIFLKFWEGKDISRSLSLRKPPVSKEQLSLSEVNTITGATISSKSVLAGVNAALEKIKTLKVEGKFGGEGNNAK